MLQQAKLEITAPGRKRCGTAWGLSCRMLDLEHTSPDLQPGKHIILLHENLARAHNENTSVIVNPECVFQVPLALFHPEMSLDS